MNEFKLILKAIGILIFNFFKEVFKNLVFAILVISGLAIIFSPTIFVCMNIRPKDVILAIVLCSLLFDFIVFMILGSLYCKVYEKYEELKKKTSD